MERLKKLTMGLIIAAASVITVSCDRDRDELVTENAKTNQRVKVKALDVETQKKIDYLVNVRGHKRDAIHIGKRYFAVDHVLYPKDINFHETSYSARSKYKTINGGQKVTQVDVIVVNMAPSKNIPQEWVDAMRYAIKAWNNLPEFDKTFTLQQTESWAWAGINVQYGSFKNDFPSFDLNPTWDAGTETPLHGFPSTKMYINSDHSLSKNEKRHAMMHELGHALNFGHTEYVFWGGKPCSHRNSIMYETNTGRAKFTTCDKEYFTSHY